MSGLRTFSIDQAWRVPALATALKMASITLVRVGDFGRHAASRLPAEGVAS